MEDWRGKIEAIPHDTVNYLIISGTEHWHEDSKGNKIGCNCEKEDINHPTKEV